MKTSAGEENLRGGGVGGRGGAGPVVLTQPGAARAKARRAQLHSMALLLMIRSILLMIYS